LLDGESCTSLGYYEDGGLGCSEACTFDISACVGFCGDGVVQDDEACEGDTADVDCFDLGFDFGRPGCASCGYDLSPCRRIGLFPDGQAVITTYDVFGHSPDDLVAVGSAVALLDG